MQGFLLNFRSDYKAMIKRVEMRVDKREFAWDFVDFHTPVKREQLELNESWQARVCIRVFSTFASSSKDNKSCMRVDESSGTIEPRTNNRHNPLKCMITRCKISLNFLFRIILKMFCLPFVKCFIKTPAPGIPSHQLPTSRHWSKPLFTKTLKFLTFFVGIWKRKDAINEHWSLTF